MKVVLDETTLFDKVKACWCGKNIGGTLGAKYEGKMCRLNVTNLDELGENGPIPNDDLDLQLVNLHALETYGLLFSTKQLSDEWVDHVYFPYDEFGYSLTNMRRRLAPPFSGKYSNPFVDCMGSCIRSEIWAAVAYGKPDVAVYYAYQDSNVDHAGGEGLYSEMFFAALESLAFVNDDLDDILYKSLEYLPKDCRVYNAVNDTIKWFKDGVSYEEIRNLILDKYGNSNFTDAPQNIAFTVVALLYCNDFEDGLLKALNLGYDTDCTCATFGSIYGIIHGTKAINEKLLSSVGEIITVSPEVRGFNAPKTITELTNRTIEISKELSKFDLSLFNIPKGSNFSEQIFYIPENCVSNHCMQVSIVQVGNDTVTKNNEKTVEVTYFNNTQDVWEFYASVDGDIFLDTYKLQPKESVTVPYKIRGRHTSCMMAKYDIVIFRLHYGELWRSYNIDLHLPVSSCWEIDGTKKYVDGNEVVLNSNGTHVAQTTLNVPSDRMIKLICASNDPITVFLDDVKIIDSTRKGFYLPAYHRCPLEQQTHMIIKKGIHKVKIIVESSLPDSKFMFIPVSPNDSPNGRNSYYIDCTIGAEY